jgi:hypothetical protein
MVVPTIRLRDALGALLAAREFETGPFRLAWTRFLQRSGRLGVRRDHLAHAVTIFAADMS